MRQKLLSEGAKELEYEIRDIVKKAEKVQALGQEIYFENIGDLGKNKEFLKDERILKECLKIRLFDGLFRSSDNNMRNILVDKGGELLSIDEGDIYSVGSNAKLLGEMDNLSGVDISGNVLFTLELD